MKTLFQACVCLSLIGCGSAEQDLGSAEQDLENAIQKVADEESALNRLLEDRDRELEPIRRQVETIDMDYDRALREMAALRTRIDTQSGTQFDSAYSQTRELEQRLEKCNSEMESINRKHAPAIAAQEARLAAARSQQSALSDGS
jgi:chromosome segregation ATPase